MDQDDLEQDEQEQEEIEILPVGQAAWPGASPKQAAFLTALVNRTGRFGPAAKLAGVSKSQAYVWLKDDEEFKAHYDRAMGQVTRLLEDECIRRSVEGIPKGKYFQGMRIATEREYSDGLLMFLLRGAAPEKYRERTDVSGAVTHTHRWAGTFEELLATYRQVAAKQS